MGQNGQNLNGVDGVRLEHSDAELFDGADVVTQRLAHHRILK